MDEQREKYSFDPKSFVSAATQPQTAAVCEAEKPRGSAVSGVLGAFVGTVPWFLVSTFASFFVGWLVLFAGVFGSSLDEPESWSLAETVGFSAFSLVFVAFGVFLIFHVRRRLVVEGSTLSYLPTFGKARAFRTTDIAGMTVGANGRRLVGHDGRTLAQFEDNQENSIILLQYLSEHGVGLLVK